MIKDIQRHNQSITPNSAFLDELRTKLPEFFTADKYDDNGNLVVKGSFDIEKFQRMLKEKNIKELSSGYQIDFIGKDYAKKQSGEKSTTVIVPDLEHNSKPENIKSKNLFFTGDNLEILRHMQNNFTNSIDMIYIDPPYNTGSDGFVYPDNFEYTDQVLQDIFNLNETEILRLKSIQGRSTHSAWLTFIYPRIWLAKNLLKDTGLIFISIDDNESSNLKLILDEIFGERNFIAKYIKKSKIGGGSDTKHIVKEHEYCICYAKNSYILPDMFIPHDEEYLKRYNESDSNGRFFWDTFARPGLKNPIIYDIKAPDGTIINNGWIRSKERFIKELDEGIIKFIKKNDDTWSVQFKQYLNINGRKPRSMSMDFGGTIDGKNEIKELFSEDNYFSYPKSTTFIKKLLATITNSINDKNNFTILDFFAGSGTTAHAVMSFNVENNMNLKFISVQIPEKISKESPPFKAGYKTIDEISRKRIELAAKKIREESQNSEVDFGFKHFRLVHPNQLTLDNLDKFDADSGKIVTDKGQLVLTMNETYFDDMITPFSAKNLGIPGKASGVDTILTTWLVSDGYKFDVTTKKFDINGYEAHHVDGDRLYLISPNWGVKQTIELINLIGTKKKQFNTIVLYGYSFELESIRELESGLKSLDKQPHLLKRY